MGDPTYTEGRGEKRLAWLAEEATISLAAAFTDERDPYWIGAAIILTEAEPRRVLGFEVFLYHGYPGEGTYSEVFRVTGETANSCLLRFRLALQKEAARG